MLPSSARKRGSQGIVRTNIYTQRTICGKRGCSVPRNEQSCPGHCNTIGRQLLTSRTQSVLAVAVFALCCVLPHSPSSNTPAGRPSGVLMEGFLCGLQAMVAQRWVAFPSLPRTTSGECCSPHLGRIITYLAAIWG